MHHTGRLVLHSFDRFSGGIDRPLPARQLAANSAATFLDRLASRRAARSPTISGCERGIPSGIDLFYRSSQCCGHQRALAYLTGAESGVRSVWHPR